MLAELAPLAVGLIGSGLSLVLCTWIIEHHKSKRFKQLLDKAERVDLDGAAKWETSTRRELPRSGRRQGIGGNRAGGAS